MAIKRSTAAISLAVGSSMLITAGVVNHNGHTVKAVYQVKGVA